jgi:uncharacterized protein with PIN domain
MTYDDNKVEFWSRCSQCNRPIEILCKLCSTALLSLSFQGRVYDAWLCDECARALLNSPDSPFAGAIAAVKEEENSLCEQ